MRFCLMVLVVIAVVKVPALAAETTVYGLDSYPADVLAVQFAVDNYQKVILEGTFDFGVGWVDITMPGLTIEGSENGCLIKNGDWPFSAYPIGSDTPYNLTIRNLVIDNPGDYGIYVYGVKATDNLLVIEGCTITNAILQGIHWCNSWGSAMICGNTITGHLNSYGIGTHDNVGSAPGDYLKIIGNTIDGRAGLVSLRNDMTVTIEENSVRVTSAGIGFQSAGLPYTQRDPNLVLPGVVRNNSIEMLANSFALFIGDYYHGACNVLVQNNTAFGSCMSGIWTGPWGGWNTIMNNDFSGLTTYDAQVWASARHDVFTENVFGPVEYITAVDMFFAPHPMNVPEPTSYNTFMKNDYRLTGLPGWDDGAGCILLGFDWSYGSYPYNDVSNNLIFESGGFPVGTGGASFQVNDLGSNNRVIGLPACNVTNPGIGQDIQEARQKAVDALALLNEETAAEAVKK
jgi:hypothetical protein